MFDNETFATRAYDVARQWFWAQATLMNPNLNYASSRPGIKDADASGIINTA